MTKITNRSGRGLATTALSIMSRVNCSARRVHHQRKRGAEPEPDNIDGAAGRGAGSQRVGPAQGRSPDFLERPGGTPFLRRRAGGKLRPFLCLMHDFRDLV